MANLTNTMYLLLDALGKCDIEKARGYGKAFLTQTKYAENGNAQALLKQLDESSVHEVPYELKQFIDKVVCLAGSRIKKAVPGIDPLAAAIVSRF